MIYIIDDDRNVRDGFNLLLRSIDYDSTCFECAEDFLKNYKAGTNDLIILDMNLLGMDGCTLLEKMAMEGLHLNVIVVTGFDQPKYRECCKNYGVIAYLRKPVDGEALIDLIKYSIDLKV